MVVDTSSLLHVESLKHLKLLEGLKGTQIVIPKIGNKSRFLLTKLNIKDYYAGVVADSFH